MDILKIKGFTRVAGEQQGYTPLYLRDETFTLQLDPPGQPTQYVENVQQYVTAWKPTQAELARLNAGHAILMTVMGTSVRPCNIMVDAEPLARDLDGSEFAPGDWCNARDTLDG